MNMIREDLFGRGGGGSMLGRGSYIYGPQTKTKIENKDKSIYLKSIKIVSYWTHSLEVKKPTFFQYFGEIGNQIQLL